MAFKFVVLAMCLAAANAGFLAQPAAYGYNAYANAAAPSAYGSVGASQQSTLRSLDGNSVVSSYSKQVDGPYSSVRKTDTRVSNDAVAYAPAYHGAYAAPAYHGAYAAPAYTSYAAPAVRAYAAPAAYASYAAPAVRAYAAPAVAAYAAPAYHGAAYAAPVARAVGLGVAYSAAPAVAHLSFDGFGAHYGY